VNEKEERANKPSESKEEEPRKNEVKTEGKTSEGFLTRV
jgi:hypothetical protein